MNGENHGFLRFSKVGTHHADVLASPMTGQRQRQGSGKQTMTYQATTLRNAFAATALAFVASAILLVNTITVPVA